MNQILVTNNDIRKFRQLGKQTNLDNFTARAREVQTNELTELLGNPLMFDFFNFLSTGFTLSTDSFVRTNDTQLTATGVDLTAWIGYSLKLSGGIYVVVTAAVFTTNTLITVTGNNLTNETDENGVLDIKYLPDTLGTVEFSTENKYTRLLNGESYTKDSKTIQYDGLRGFISWKFLAIFLSDANVKHSDTGNFSITSNNFQRPSNADKVSARSTYLQNSTREENHIIDYLNTLSTTFPLWDSKNNENLENYNFIVV